MGQRHHHSETLSRLVFVICVLSVVLLSVAIIEECAADSSRPDALDGIKLDALASATLTRVGSTLDTHIEPDRQHDLILDFVRLHRRGHDEVFVHLIADAIFEEAIAAQVDPLMVASIVAVESSFRERVVSSVGAVGLMQLRPFVAEDVARRRQVEWTGIETLYTPKLNVRLGILYYKELIDRFGGDEYTALAAYNRGPTRVDRQLRHGTFSGCPYAERVIRSYRNL